MKKSKKSQIIFEVNLENYGFLCVKQILQQNNDAWLKPIYTLDVRKVKESHNMCFKRLIVQKRETNKRHYNKPKKSRNGMNDKSCIYYREIKKNQKRNCSSYLTE